MKHPLKPCPTSTKCDPNDDAHLERCGAILDQFDLLAQTLNQDFCLLMDWLYAHENHPEEGLEGQPNMARTEMFYAYTHRVIPAMDAFMEAIDLALREVTGAESKHPTAKLEPQRLKFIHAHLERRRERLLRRMITVDAVSPSNKIQ